MTRSGEHAGDPGQGEPDRERDIPRGVLEDHGADAAGIARRVTQRQHPAEGLAEHGPAADAERLPHGLAVVDHLGDGQGRPGSERR
ncbi:MAG TPA: hypothetical protein VGG35_05040 [Streptosporangiaceae bacterium]|jgi:hypothetical protein